LCIRDVATGKGVRRLGLHGSIRAPLSPDPRILAARDGPCGFAELRSHEAGD
jgi:hypothetical protein